GRAAGQGVGKPAERGRLDPDTEVRDQGAGPEETIVTRAERTEHAATSSRRHVPGQTGSVPGAPTRAAIRRSWSQRAASMASATRVASVMIVTCGFTLHEDGKRLASAIQSDGVPCTRPVESVTAPRASSPIRAVPCGWNAIISNSVGASVSPARARASSIERRTGREWTPGYTSVAPPAKKISAVRPIARARRRASGAPRRYVTRGQRPRPARTRPADSSEISAPKEPRRV